MAEGKKELESITTEEEICFQMWFANRRWINEAGRLEDASMGKIAREWKVGHLTRHCTPLYCYLHGLSPTINLQIIHCWIPSKVISTRLYFCSFSPHKRGLVWCTHTSQSNGWLMSHSDGMSHSDVTPASSSTQEQQGSNTPHLQA